MPDLDLHRELDARELMLGTIAQWPIDAVLCFLRDSLRERITETDAMIQHTNRILGERV